MDRLTVHIGACPDCTRWVETWLVHDPSLRQLSREPVNTHHSGRVLFSAHVLSEPSEPHEIFGTECWKEFEYNHCDRVEISSYYCSNYLELEGRIAKVFYMVKR